jgi:hypothetical protein
VAYALLTFVFGCWSRADIEYLDRLRLNMAGDRFRVIATFLEWASARSARDFL